MNERNYGALQGLNKKDTEDKYGVAQVLISRRSYATAPPNRESLGATFERVILYYQQEIEPKLKDDENILIVAHGISLRALMMHLEDISTAEIA